MIATGDPGRASGPRSARERFRQRTLRHEHRGSSPCARPLAQQPTHALPRRRACNLCRRQTAHAEKLWRSDWMAGNTVESIVAIAEIIPIQPAERDGHSTRFLVFSIKKGEKTSHANVRHSARARTGRTHRKPHAPPTRSMMAAPTWRTSSLPLYGACERDLQTLLGTATSVNIQSGEGMLALWRASRA